MAIEVTVAVPLYDEAECVPELVRRLRQALSEHAACEFLFVLDGCTDQTLELLLHEKERDPRIRILEFSRNFGLHAAVHACLRESRGEGTLRSGPIVETIDGRTYVHDELEDDLARHRRWFFFLDDLEVEARVSIDRGATKPWVAIVDELGHSIRPVAVNPIDPL